MPSCWYWSNTFSYIRAFVLSDLYKVIFNIYYNGFYIRVCAQLLIMIPLSSLEGWVQAYPELLTFLKFIFVSNPHYEHVMFVKCPQKIIFRLSVLSNNLHVVKTGGKGVSMYLTDKVNSGLKYKENIWPKAFSCKITICFVL